MKQSQCCGGGGDGSGDDGSGTGPDFARVEDKQQLLTLASQIKQYLPFSVTMYNILLEHGHGFSSHDTFYTLSSSPHAHVIIRQSKDELWNVGIFCCEEEIHMLIEALKTTNIIDWRSCVIVCALPFYLVEPVRETGLGLKHTFQLRRHHTYIYHPHLDNQPLKCSRGYKVCRLGQAGVRRLLERSRYNKREPVDESCRRAEKMPCLGVYLDPSVTQDTPVDLDNITFAGEEELPVSWVSVSKYGGIGNLGTDDEHRRKGFGTLLITMLARLQARQGFVPHAHVDFDNTVSQSLFNKALGWVNTHSATWLH